MSEQSEPPIFYREATWYDKGGWVWQFTTGSPQGYVDFHDERWLDLLNGWAIVGRTLVRKPGYKWVAGE